MYSSLFQVPYNFSNCLPPVSSRLQDNILIVYHCCCSWASTTERSYSCSYHRKCCPSSRNDTVSDPEHLCHTFQASTFYQHPNGVTSGKIIQMTSSGLYVCQITLQQQLSVVEIIVHLAINFTELPSVHCFCPLFPSDVILLCHMSYMCMVYSMGPRSAS